MANICSIYIVQSWCHLVYVYNYFNTSTVLHYTAYVSTYILCIYTYYNAYVNVDIIS